MTLPHEVTAELYLSKTLSRRATLEAAALTSLEKIIIDNISNKMGIFLKKMIFSLP
jgi:hypothetical protein